MRISRIALAILVASLVLMAWLARRPPPDAGIVPSPGPLPPVALSPGESAEPEPPPLPETSVARIGIREPAAQSTPARAAQPGGTPPMQSTPSAEAPAIQEPPLQSQPAPGPVPLEKLQLPKPGYRKPEPVLVLDTPEEPANGAAPRKPSPIEVRHRSEEVGPMGPDRRTVGDAEVGVSVPVDDAVRVKGGVRVDYDQDPKKERTQIDSTPTVGVEVRF